MTQSPNAFTTSNHASHRVVVGGTGDPGSGTPLGSGAGGSCCSSGSGVNCGDDSSVNTCASLGACHAAVNFLYPRIQSVQSVDTSVSVKQPDIRSPATRIQLAGRRVSGQ